MLDRGNHPTVIRFGSPRPFLNDHRRVGGVGQGDVLDWNGGREGGVSVTPCANTAARVELGPVNVHRTSAEEGVCASCGQHRRVGRTPSTLKSRRWWCP